MANFEFRSFWAKKMDFFDHGAPILLASYLEFALNFFKFTQKLNFQVILKSGMTYWR